MKRLILIILIVVSTISYSDNHNVKYKLSSRSLGNMEGLDSRLQVLIGLMADKSPYDFIVTEGLRTKERQKELVKNGKSMTMNSYHLTGNAFDVAMIDENGKVTWDARYYKEFADVLLRVADSLGYDITWGGSWKNFVDCPHFQLNRR